MDAISCSSQQQLQYLVSPQRPSQKCFQAHKAPHAFYLILGFMYGALIPILPVRNPREFQPNPMWILNFTFKSTFEIVQLQTP